MAEIVTMMTMMMMMKMMMMMMTEKKGKNLRKVGYYRDRFIVERQIGRN